MTTVIRAGEVSTVSLTVRLYNTAHVPAEQLVSAQKTAESILQIQNLLKEHGLGMGDVVMMLEANERTQPV